MKLVLICGPQAVGKMTVGQELAKITELKLFHNHMTIDIVSNFFNYGTATGMKLVDLFRNAIFGEVAKSNLEGIIFTLVWAFNLEGDYEYVEEILDIFRKNNADIYIVELQADFNERLRRNKTPNRLKHKPKKRDIEWSENLLVNAEMKDRFNSEEGEITEKNYLKIDNTNMSAKKAAKMIKDKFNL